MNTTTIKFNRKDRDYTAYAIIDGVEQSLGNADSYEAAEAIAREWRAGLAELEHAAMHARPAEPVAVVFVEAEQAATTDEPSQVITEVDIVAARQYVAANLAAGKQVDFDKALLASPDLTPDMIQHWLNATPNVRWCACEGGDHSRIVCTECGLPPYWKSCDPDSDDIEVSITAAATATPEPITKPAVAFCDCCDQTKPTSAFRRGGGGFAIPGALICDECIPVLQRIGAAAIYPRFCASCLSQPARFELSEMYFCDDCSNAAVERVAAALRSVCPNCDTNTLCPECEAQVGGCE